MFYSFKYSLVLFIPLFFLKVSAEEASNLAPAAQVQRILILGDSLTEGYGIDQDKAFPALTEKLLNAKKKRVEIINAGSSGDTSASASGRLKWHLKKKPDILILALGANDGLRGLDPKVTKKNLGSAIDIAKKQGVKVILAGMKMPRNYGAEYRKAFDGLYPELANEKEIVLWPFLLEGVGAVKELNLADGIHPNEKGHEIIAKNLAEFLEKQL